MLKSAASAAGTDIALKECPGHRFMEKDARGGRRAVQIAALLLFPAGLVLLELAFLPLIFPPEAGNAPAGRSTGGGHNTPGPLRKFLDIFFPRRLERLAEIETKSMKQAMDRFYRQRGRLAKFQSGGRLPGFYVGPPVGLSFPAWRLRGALPQKTPLTDPGPPAAAEPDGGNFPAATADAPAAKPDAGKTGEPARPAGPETDQTAEGARYSLQEFLSGYDEPVGPSGSITYDFFGENPAAAPDKSPRISKSQEKSDEEFTDEDERWRRAAAEVKFDNGPTALFEISITVTL